MTSRFTELAIDCADPHGLAGFWCEVLDYEVRDQDDGIVTIGPPGVPEGMLRPGPAPPALTFARVPEAKTVKNRLHIDLRTSDVAEATEQALRLGATRADDVYSGGSWQVLRDPEGNEFCLLRP